MELLTQNAAVKLTRVQAATIVFQLREWLRVGGPDEIVLRVNLGRQYPISLHATVDRGDDRAGASGQAEKVVDEREPLRAL